MSRLSPIAHFLAEVASDATFVEREVSDALLRANSNHGRNTYLKIESRWTLDQVHARQSLVSKIEPIALLAGVPVSLKDCFDLEGFPTTCGSRYYARQRGLAAHDSSVAASLKSAGAVIIGKTHMHQLAYGITGESLDYGDCLQPKNAGALTGGSSSGAAASVQEGSALAAIGTDTGGSIRVPAALCGLSGYRSSYGLTDWQGAHHLAPSFDTAGWIFRDLRDAPRLARALWGPRMAHLHDAATPNARIGCAPHAWLDDCDSSVLDSYDVWRERLLGTGAAFHALDVDFWQEAPAIFAPIQAHEASQLHSGLFHNFEPSIAARLAWGASLSEDKIAHCRSRHAAFSRRMQELFTHCDFMLLPATPIAQLKAGADHSAARQQILRYTTPASLAGLPVALLPGPPGGGMQLMAPHGCDASLLAYAAYLGDMLATDQ